MPQNRTLEEFQSRNNLKFSDATLLKTVFVHRSYLNEAGDNTQSHNERLEFLGDAVLELVVTEYLYKTFNNPEGELTNWRSSIVKGEVLAKVAAEIELGEYLFLSRGEEKSGGRHRGLILANTFEALIGAVYLDMGYDKASDFIHKYLICLLPEIIEKRLYIDPKSRLQEVCQEDLGATPEYRVLNEQGPDHQKEFVIGVYAAGKQMAQGSGSSKQRAEQNAASEALENWKSISKKSK